MKILSLKNIKRFLLVFLLVIVSACSDTCIDADNWGYPVIKVSSEAKDLNISGIKSQVAEPIDSGQILLDADKIPLVIAIDPDDQWTSWFGGESNPYIVPKAVKSRSFAADITKDESEESTDGIRLEPGYNPERLIPDRECQYQINSTLTGETSTFQQDGYKPITLTGTDVNLRNSNDPRPQVSKARRYMGEKHDGSDLASCPPVGTVVANPDSFPDCRVPCYIRDGMGLYIGLAHDNGSQRDIVVTRHIPDAKFPEVQWDYSKKKAENMQMPYDITGKLVLNDDGNIALGRGMDNYLVKGLPSEEIPGARTKDRLYFKILDTYYHDNAGSYTVKIKEGTRSPKKGIIETIVDSVKGPVMSTMRLIWETVVKDSNFLSIIRSAMYLFMVFYTYGFVIGTSKVSAKDLMINVVKLGFVAQLLAPNSFEFFYDNFFVAFLEGVDNLIALVVTPFGDYDPTSPWYSLDQIISKFFSEPTFAKVSATLFSDKVGFLFYFLIYLAFFLFLIAALKAIITYLIAIIAMAVLVVIAPIIIILYLFNLTKELLDEYVSQFVALGLELIVLFAGIGLFGAVIVHFLEQLVGFRACGELIFDLRIFDTSIFQIGWWMPDLRISDEYQTYLWLDENGDGAREIGEQVLRYIDLPYFDIEHDAEKISRYASERNFLQMSDILVLILAIFVMNSFLDYVPDLANGLKGASLTKSASAGASDGGSTFNSLWESIRGRRGGKFEPASARAKAAGKDGKAFRKLGWETLGRVARDGGFLGRGISTVTGNYNLFKKASGKVNKDKSAYEKLLESELKAKQKKESKNKPSESFLSTFNSFLSSHNESAGDDDKVSLAHFKEEELALIESDIIKLNKQLESDKVSAERRIQARKDKIKEHVLKKVQENHIQSAQANRKGNIHNGTAE